MEIRVESSVSVGVDFEPVVLRAMLLSPGFLSRYAGLITPDLFRLPLHAFLGESLAAFHRQYKEVPSREVLCDVIRRSDFRDRAAAAAWVESAGPVDNAQYVADRVIEWARWTKILSVIEADDRADPRAFGSRVDAASRVGDGLLGSEARMAAGDMGESVDLRRPVVPTPWAFLNDRMGGGPELQDFCIFSAFQNVGKTALLVNVAAAALAAGELVCFGSFEDGEAKVKRRFLQWITGWTKDQVVENQQVALVVAGDWFAQTGGTLRIKRLRSRRTSVEDWAAYVRRCEEEEGRKCRLFISDYMDRFDPPKGRKDPRHEYREVAEECKLAAADLDAVHWSATQANAKALNQDTVGLDKTGESQGKTEGADLVVGAGQTAADVPLGILTLFTSKVRDAAKFESVRLQADFDRQRITEIPRR